MSFAWNHFEQTLSETQRQEHNVYQAEKKPLCKLILNLNSLTPDPLELSKYLNDYGFESIFNESFHLYLKDQSIDNFLSALLLLPSDSVFVVLNTFKNIEDERFLNCFSNTLELSLSTINTTENFDSFLKICNTFPDILTSQHQTIAHLVLSHPLPKGSLFQFFNEWNPSSNEYWNHRDLDGKTSLRLLLDRVHEHMHTFESADYLSELHACASVLLEHVPDPYDALLLKPPLTKMIHEDQFLGLIQSNIEARKINSSLCAPPSTEQQNPLILTISKPKRL